MAPADFKAIAEQLVSHGVRPVLISTTDPMLPFALFKSPTIAQLSQYSAKASDASVGPLLAAVALARMTIAVPDIEPVVSEKPFVVMRAVQALLIEFGLSARAEKKSL